MTKVSIVTQKWLATSNLEPSDLIASMKDGRKWLKGRNCFEWNGSILVGFTIWENHLSIQLLNKKFVYLELGQIESSLKIRGHNIPETMISAYHNNNGSINNLIDTSGNFSVFASSIVDKIENCGQDVKIYLSNKWDKFRTPLSETKIIKTDSIKQLI